ncbi:hypothetical protein Rhopal_005574-T1 [Rhodotorula paludigena]|uniref:polynucleotide adenylyltransferase n=1 Tax=Rhodotorula paludigena TaxID=86838 RepID=A0AAV5GPW3_9BASI|nr:hypothetical protein Rhopal_005574-T1 [Rhodotorula paludigena]
MAPAASLSSSSRSAAPAPAPAANASFVAQQDFISFDDPDDSLLDDNRRSPSPPPDRTTPGTSRRNKRARAHDDDRGSRDDDHGSRRLQNRERARSTPWCDDPGVDWDRCASATEQLNAEARAFVRYISPSPHEHELRLWTIELIRRTIAHKYPDSAVECFGSVGTGLYLPGGDIDLVVVSPSLPAPPLKPSSSLLHRLASLLLTSSIAAPQSLVVIAKARVPIVKFQTRHGGFSVDLSVNQHGGVDAAVRVRKLLEEYAFREEGYVEPGAARPELSIKGKAHAVDSDDDDDDDEPEEGELPSASASASASLSRASSAGGGGGEGAQHAVDHGVARSLVLLVKAFLSQRGMNEVFTGGLGSYSIICLVISFLQLHPKIQTAALNPNRNLGLLFLEFLELYGKHFNYDQTGITVRARGGYFNKHDKGWFRAQQPYLLSIEDPNDPLNDVSGGSHAILRVRQTLAGGFDVLAATLAARQSLVAARRNPALAPSRPLDASRLPNADSDAPSEETRSLLGGIIGLGRADRDKRERDRELWESGVLQRLLERTEPSFSSSSKRGKKRSSLALAPAAENEDEAGGKDAKRRRKEERERDKRDRTVARLERRKGEKEAQRERRRAKKAADRADEVVVVVRPLVGPREVDEAKAKAVGIGALADVEMHHQLEAEDGGGGGFVIDSVGAGVRGRAPPAAEDDDEDESRYSLGVPALAKPSTTSKAAASPVYTHVTDDSSASSNGGDDDDDALDGDVVLGGTGGDFVRGSRAGTVSRAASTTTTGGGSSDEVVEAALVPSRGGAAAATAKKRAGAAGQQKGKGKGKDAGEKKKAREAKTKARMAFWSTKGRKEDGPGDGEYSD